MWVYNQKTGVLANDDTHYQCYAGFGVGKNNPVMQDVKSVGPLPVGKYKMGTPYDSARTGPYTIPLIPDPSNEMYHRGDFRIHGDSRTNPGTASHGCIIRSPKSDRQAIYNSGDRDVHVISGVEVQV